MKRQRMIVLGLAAVGFLAFYYFYGGSAAPSGQQPMIRLDAANVTTLSDAFNGSAHSVRVLVLLSPT
jgi:hypothetical protein